MNKQYMNKQKRDMYIAYIFFITTVITLTFCIK